MLSVTVMQCQHCHRDIADAEPVYRVQLWGGHPWCRAPIYPTVRHLCTGCATSETMRHYKLHPPTPCHHCGRPVHHGARRKVPEHVACSPECRLALNATLARARRQLRTRASLTCETCGKLFPPKRADARFCSFACKQRAYRQRQAITPTATPP